MNEAETPMNTIKRNSDNMSITGFHMALEWEEEYNSA